MLWSKRLRSEQFANYEGIDLSHAGAGRPNETLGMLDRLPSKFTVAEACQTLLDKTPFFFAGVWQRLASYSLFITLALTYMPGRKSLCSPLIWA